jgi:hypothetical protein
MQSNCRYGPGRAYLYAAGLYPGDTAVIWGRNAAGTWLWVQPNTISYQCWLAASSGEVQGDIFSVVVQSVRLPHSTLYGQPAEVTATRSGDQVTVSWSAVWMTEDDFRGYLLEVTLCQNTQLIWTAVATNDTSYTFTDGAGCASASGGLLYAVEKHGYTDPVKIPWP